MKKRIWLFAIMLGSALPVSLFGQTTNGTMYFVGMFDIHDNNIGEGVTKDSEKVPAAFKKYATAMNMGFINKSMNDFTNDAAIKYINSINPTTNDILVVYFSGHGVGDTYPPNLQVPIVNGSTKIISYANLSAAVKGKESHNWILLDCCADFVEGVTPRAHGEVSNKAINPVLLSRLFKTGSGRTNVFCGVSRGEKGYTNINHGSYFTNNLLSGIDSVGEGSWNIGDFGTQVRNSTQESVRKATNRKRDQNPQLNPQKK